MTILVTGGDGWIGSAVRRRLSELDRDSVSFDRTSGNDVRDPDDVAAAVKSVDYVIHLAGVLGTHELFDRPQTAVEVNVLGTLNVIEACATQGVGLTMITIPDVNPSLYAATKFCGQRMANVYAQSHGLHVNFVRAFNVYGPGQAVGDGHPQKIVPTFATRAWAGEPIPVWGDGRLWVDLVHVDDVADVLVRATEVGTLRTIDAGTGHRQRVIEVAGLVNEIAGSQAGILLLPPRVGERAAPTPGDYAGGIGWELLEHKPPRWSRELFIEAVESYR